MTRWLHLLAVSASGILTCISTEAADREKKSGGAAVVPLSLEDASRTIQGRMQDCVRDGIGLFRVEPSIPESVCFALRHTAIDAGISPALVVVQIEPSALKSDKRSLIYYFSPNGSFNSRNAVGYVRSVELWLADLNATETETVREHTLKHTVITPPPTLAKSVRESSSTREAVAMLTAAFGQTFGSSADREATKMADGSREIALRTTVDEYKRPGRSGRLLLGAAAGSSTLEVTVDFCDSRSGTVFARRNFRQTLRSHPQGWAYGDAEFILFLRLADEIAAAVREVPDIPRAGAGLGTTD